MNIYICWTIIANATKFGKNMSYQLHIIPELIHTHFHLRKLNKIEMIKAITIDWSLRSTTSGMCAVSHWVSNPFECVCLGIMGVRMFKDVSGGCFVGRFVCFCLRRWLWSFVCSCVRETRPRYVTYPHTPAHTLIPSHGRRQQQAGTRRDFRRNEYSCDMPCLRLLRFNAELSRIQSW